MGNMLYFIKSYLNKVDFKKNTDTQSNVEESQAKKKLKHMVSQERQNKEEINDFIQ